MASVSPFVAALPSQRILFEYDADGDAIMIDAETGEPIRYDANQRRASASTDADSEDSRPSKRSRSSSDEESAPVAPWAPVKAPRPSAPAEEDDEEGLSALRNLADLMANAELPYGDHTAMLYFLPIPEGDTRPSVQRIPAPPPDIDFRDLPSPIRHLEMMRYQEQLDRGILIDVGERLAPEEPAPASAPPGDAPAEEDQEDGGAAAESNSYGDSDGEEPEWIIQAEVPDLALRLDMRHPRVLLNFLRFVDTYNELAPAGEEIHFPYFSAQNIDYVRNHEGVRNVPPEFEGEVAELLALLERYRRPDA